jgi:hypothetical protein
MLAATAVVGCALIDLGCRQNMIFLLLFWSHSQALLQNRVEFLHRKLRIRCVKKHQC